MLSKAANDSARPIIPFAPNAMSGVSAVAFVFDHLSPDARARATRAALAYLQKSANQAELFGVFVTDLSVVEVQPFTDDRELVKFGLEKAGLHDPSLYTSTTARQSQLRHLLTKGQSSFDAGLAAMELRMLERTEELERDQQGNATTRGLLLIASSLRLQPGRKAVIFFSEGMILPTSVMETFRSIINAANRNNVSFYTVDAAGLRAESKAHQSVSPGQTNRDSKSG